MRPGPDWTGMARQVRRGWDGIGEERRGRCGLAGRGWVRQGLARQVRQGRARRGRARLGLARQGRHGDNFMPTIKDKIAEKELLDIYYNKVYGNRKQRRQLAKEK